VIRPFTIDDLWVFWAAYCENSFPVIPAGRSREEVDLLVLEYLAKNDSNLLIEDSNRRFKSGRGPVGVIMVHRDGTVIEPTAVFFKWATALNCLRAGVRFFMWIGYNRQTSACVVKCYDNAVNLLHRVKDYGVLLYVGKIRGGNPNGKGDQYVFSTRGKFGIGPDGH
jgi:hypothetical protein